MVSACLSVKLLVFRSLKKLSKVGRAAISGKRFLQCPNSWSDFGQQCVIAIVNVCVTIKLGDLPTSPKSVSLFQQFRLKPFSAGQSFNDQLLTGLDSSPLNVQ